MESSQVFRKNCAPSSKLQLASKIIAGEDPEVGATSVVKSHSQLITEASPERPPEGLHPITECVHRLQLPLKPVNRDEIRKEQGCVTSLPRKERRRSDVSLPTIKQEVGLGFKECVLCAGRTDETFDVFTETTCCGHVTLCSYISKVSNIMLDRQLCATKYACRSCFELLNVVEQAELEYTKHRDLLLDIIDQNAALRYRQAGVGTLNGDLVKIERCKEEKGISSDDDEPLVFMKPRRRKQIKLSTKGPSKDDYRNSTSGEEFNWQLEANNQDDLSVVSPIKCSFKKLRHVKEPKIKEEEDQKDPAEILIVELKEECEEDWSVPHKKKNRKGTKHKEKRDGEKKRRSKENIDKIDITCVKCNKTFTKKTYYDYHMARHDNAHLPFICEVCGKGFKNRKICDAHVLMHQGIADYKCIQCDKLFPTKFAFLRHDKIHQGKPKHQCDQCGKSFIHNSSFRMHKLAHAGIKKHSCDICGLALLSSSHLIRHKRIHSGEKRYECDSCGKKFSEKYNMQSHMKSHMKGKERAVSPVDTPGKRKRWFRCERCEEKFDRLFKLEIHLVDDHKVVLKKGRPKPRNTMKKLQRAQQAAASMVSAIASAMGAKRAADQMKAAASSEMATNLDMKPSFSTLNEKIKEAAGSGTHMFKTSPLHVSMADHSMSPVASYMSPPSDGPAISGVGTREYQEHHHQHMIRSASAVWPHMTYNMGMGYLGRKPDYSQH